MTVCLQEQSLSLFIKGRPILCRQTKQNKQDKTKQDKVYTFILRKGQNQVVFFLSSTELALHGHLLNNMNFHPRYRYYLDTSTHDGVGGVTPQTCSTATPQRREQAAGPAPHQRHDVQC